jgi:hypothetical protein
MFHVRSLICVLLIVLLLLLADKSSGLELIMPDGTAGHYEGERNERGEPHGRGRVLNARGEAVAGDTWVDGAQEGECQSRQLLVDTLASSTYALCCITDLISIPSFLSYVRVVCLSRLLPSE